MLKRLIAGASVLLVLAAVLGGVTDPDQADRDASVAWLSNGVGGGSVHFKTGEIPAWMAEHIGARPASTGTGSHRLPGLWI